MEATAKATSVTLEERALKKFWTPVKAAGDAVAAGREAAAQKTCEQVGTFKNPRKLNGDKLAAGVKWFIKLVQTFGAGKIDPGIDNPNDPDPISQAIYQENIRASVKPGEYFYFSSQPNWIFHWTGDYISTVYDTETGSYYSYDRDGNSLPVF